MKWNVANHTLKANRCIGCGICEVACPTNAIQMIYNNYKEYIPVINDRCIDCGQCIDYCPHSEKNLKDQIMKMNKFDNLCDFGVNPQYKYYLSHAVNEDNRVRSASGGIVTSLAGYLLQNNLITGVIHVERILGNIGDEHYRACISQKVDELEKRRSSVYGPICFSNVIDKIQNNEGKYLVIGVPCVIRGIKKFLSNKKNSKTEIITIALACSHNVNGQFSDYLAQSLGQDKNKPFMINMRNKEGIPDANNFNIQLYDLNGEIIKVNRFKADFTKIWRNYFFSMNSCNYCNDFWGNDGDISVKDAWGKYAINPLGESIVVVRNENLNKILNEINQIWLQKIEYDIVRKNQIGTIKYKQSNILWRLNKSKFHYKNIYSGFLAHYFFSMISKRLYFKGGYKFIKFFLFPILILVYPFGLFKSIVRKLSRKLERR